MSTVPLDSKNMKSKIPAIKRKIPANKETKTEKKTCSEYAVVSLKDEKNLQTREVDKQEVAAKAEHVKQPDRVAELVQVNAGLRSEIEQLRIEKDFLQVIMVVDQLNKENVRLREDSVLLHEAIKAKEEETRREKQEKRLLIEELSAERAAYQKLLEEKAELEQRHEKLSEMRASGSDMEHDWTPSNFSLASVWSDTTTRDDTSDTHEEKMKKTPQTQTKYLLELEVNRLTSENLDLWEKVEVLSVRIKKLEEELQVYPEKVKDTEPVSSPSSNSQSSFFVNNSCEVPIVRCALPRSAKEIGDDLVTSESCAENTACPMSSGANASISPDSVTKTDNALKHDGNSALKITDEKLSPDSSDSLILHCPDDSSSKPAISDVINSTDS